MDERGRDAVARAQRRLDLAHGADADRPQMARLVDRACPYGERRLTLRGDAEHRRGGAALGDAAVVADLAQVAQDLRLAALQLRDVALTPVLAAAARSAPTLTTNPSDAKGAARSGSARP